MTLLELSDSELPHLSPFLNTVCPGHSYLDDNIHFLLRDDIFRDAKLSIHWPITDPSSTMRAELQKSYLNIARPPLSRQSNESTTYVSNPLHVTSIFRRAIERNHKVNEGNFHIGANINSLAQDPFKEVLNNPGCLSHVLDLHSNKVMHSHNSNVTSDEKSHVQGRQTNSNWLKIKKSSILGAETHRSFHSLFDLRFEGIIEKVLNYSKDSYHTSLGRSNKLLISSHVNVLNIFGIQSEPRFSGTADYVVDEPVLPFVLGSNDEAKSHKNSAASASKRVYRKVVETPLLRIQWNKGLVITCMRSILSAGSDPFVIIGFDTGAIAILNLSTLTLQLVPDFEEKHSTSQDHTKHHISLQPAHSLIPLFVSSIESIEHPDYDFLIVAGYSNGEVAIIDPFPKSQPSLHHHHHFSEILHTSLFLTHHLSDCKDYVKKIVAFDASATYYKRFDLSQWARKDGRNLQHLNSRDSAYPPCLVGHFKISHKPVTSIASTALRVRGEYHHLGHHHHTHSLRPSIVAIGCGDGLVRIIDLNQTLDGDYGVLPLESSSETQIFGRSLISEMIPNYFNDNVTSLCFSPDARFLCVAGSGDMIELYRITYSNIGHVLHKNSRVPTAKRSRSGTINSFVSEPQTARSHPTSDLLSPASNVVGDSLQLDAVTHSKLSTFAQQIKASLPPFVKDVKIAARLKGHLNVVSSVSFIDNENAESSSSLICNLVSCGQDGKIMVWEFDHKALPRPKKHVLISKGRIGDDGLLSLVKTVSLDNLRRARPLMSNFGATRMSVSHSRSRSMASTDLAQSPVFPSGFGGPNSGSMTVTNILEILQPRPTNSSRGSQNTEPDEDLKIEFLNSLYKNAFNLRLKRHFKTQTSLQKALAGKVFTIFHPIVDDKLVPSIRIPILEIKLAKIVGSNTISGFYTDSEGIWCFSKSGDIFRFCVQYT